MFFKSTTANILGETQSRAAMALIIDYQVFSTITGKSFMTIRTKFCVFFKLSLKVPKLLAMAQNFAITKVIYNF